MAMPKRSVAKRSNPKSVMRSMPKTGWREPGRDCKFASQPHSTLPFFSNPAGDNLLGLPKRRRLTPTNELQGLVSADTAPASQGDETAATHSPTTSATNVEMAFLTEEDNVSSLSEMSETEIEKLNDVMEHPAKHYGDAKAGK